MAKQFLANRSGQTPTLDEVPNEVIKIYDDKAAAQADISNIEENEIIATKAGESEGVVEVVDTVEENNPNAVSSGAVFDAINLINSKYFFLANNASINLEIPENHSILLFGWKAGTNAFFGMFGNYASGIGSYVSIAGTGSFTITRVDTTHVTITNTSGASVNLTVAF